MKRPFQRETGWKFYHPDDGGSADSATPIYGWSWTKFYDAEDAAKQAADQDWSDSCGDIGIGNDWEITVISPEGEETHFTAQGEATIIFHVTEKEQ